MRVRSKATPEYYGAHKVYPLSKRLPIFLPPEKIDKSGVICLEDEEHNRQVLQELKRMRLATPSGKVGPHVLWESTGRIFVEARSSSSILFYAHWSAGTTESPNGSRDNLFVWTQDPRILAVLMSKVLPMKSAVTVRRFEIQRDPGLWAKLLCYLVRQGRKVSVRSAYGKEAKVLTSEQDVLAGIEILISLRAEPMWSEVHSSEK